MSRGYTDVQHITSQALDKVPSQFFQSHHYPLPTIHNTGESMSYKTLPALQHQAKDIYPCVRT